MRCFEYYKLIAILRRKSGIILIATAARDCASSASEVKARINKLIRNDFFKHLTIKAAIKHF